MKTQIGSALTPAAFTAFARQAKEIYPELQRVQFTNVAVLVAHAPLPDSIKAALVEMHDSAVEESKQAAILAANDYDRLDQMRRYQGGKNANVKRQLKKANDGYFGAKGKKL